VLFLWGKITSDTLAESAVSSVVICNAVQIHLLFLIPVLDDCIATIILVELINRVCYHSTEVAQ
jgi:hypothetical protein